MDNKHAARLGGIVLAVVLLAGCQVGGAPIDEHDGYFSWVDEQGQVRYSRIPGEFTEEHYPDGDQLAQDGFIRPGQRQPYYTWRDAEGIVRVSYYTPDTRSERESKPDQPPVNLTPASVYLPAQELSQAQPVEGHDPDAFAVLGIESTPQNLLSSFASDCCAGLSNRDQQPWHDGREFGISIPEDAERYPFSTGDSRFQLVALPSGAFAHGFVMRLRSYARAGVFVPSLAFLDGDFQPVRLVIDLVMDYHPETWRRLGYLEAWVPVFPGEGERWLLVFTREGDLHGQTVYDAGHGPVVIPHMPHGELGLTRFDE